MTLENVVGKGPTPSELELIVSLNLKDMKGLAEALADSAIRAFRKVNPNVDPKVDPKVVLKDSLATLEKMSAEEQKQLVIEAFEVAEKRYFDTQNSVKLPLIGKTREVYKKGELPLSALLVGLRLKQDEKKNNDGGFLGRFSGRNR